MKKRIRIMIVVMCLILVAGMIFTSCNSKSNSKGVTVTFAHPEEVTVWDPQNHFTTSGLIVQTMIYDRLTEMKDGKVVPYLATEWTSPDGKDWTFKLRQGVKFSNGEVFDAQSVKVTLERFLNEKLAMISLWKDFIGVEVIDSYNVKLKFNNPTGTLFAALNVLPMLPPKAFIEQGIKLFEKPIGTGPFTFVEWKKSEYVELAKNPNYWGEKPFIDKFRYLPIMEDSTRVAGVLTGDIDSATTIPPDQVKQLSEKPNVEIVKLLSWDQILLGFKCDKAPFNDIRVRQALSLAINRDSIVKDIMSGGRVSTGYIMKGSLGFNESIQPVKRDVEKAKQLLKDSSYNGKPVTLLAPSGWYPKTNEVLQAIKAQAKEIGLEITLEILEGATYSEKRGAGNYDLFMKGGAHNSGDPNILMSYIVNDVPKTGYKNEEMFKFILDGNKSVDQVKRAELYGKADEIMAKEFAPQITIFQLEAIILKRNIISGERYLGDKTADFRYVKKTTAK